MNNMKPTKRLGFHFMRSYFDVLNKLENDADKLSFLLSIINKQFTDEDPKDLNFLVELCYESQRHAIEKSVKGWKTANKTDLLGNPTPPNGSPLIPPNGSPSGEVQVQVQVQVQEKEESIYSEYKFLQNWSTCRRKFLNKPTNISKLENYEKVNFDKAKREFTKEEINLALLGLFKQENKNISSMYLKPKHFLENVSKYLNAELAKQYDIYGKDESKQSKKGGL